MVDIHVKARPCGCGHTCMEDHVSVNTHVWREDHVSVDTCMKGRPCECLCMEGKP